MIFCSYRLSRRADAEKKHDSELAAWLLTIFLVAPFSWEHHLVYILPAALLALRKLLVGRLSAGLSAMVFTALFLIARRIPFWDAALTHGWWTLLVSVKCYAVLALWIFFLFDLQNFRDSETPPEPTASC